MKPSVAAALALSCLAPMAVLAQAADSGSYSYCWVKGEGTRDIWLSQLFSTPPGTDPQGDALAIRFVAHVATLAKIGTGDKQCVTAAPREAAESRRHAELTAIKRKPMFGKSSYDLHELDWTPPAGNPADPAPSAVMTQSDKPTRSDIDQLIASDAFFQLPEGAGKSVRRSGSRMVNKTVPLKSDSTLRRNAGSNQCHLEQTVLAGEGGLFKSTASGETWAGIIPLNMRSTTSSERGVISTVLKAVAIVKLAGQPFPLTAGHSFGWSVSYEALNNSTDTARYGQNWTCTVGATALASTSIPGMAGEQTEVHCHLDFVSVPVPPQDQVYFWYNAAGCFMQDPTR